MTTLTVTAKGQVTLRRETLRHLKIGPGDKLQIDARPNGEVVLRKASQPGSWDDFVGFFDDPQMPHLTLDEIKRAIEDGWAGTK
jgi:antitoxin PrlF